MRTCRISLGELPYIYRSFKKKIQGIHLSMETITSYFLVIVVVVQSISLEFGFLMFIIHLTYFQQQTIAMKIFECKRIILNDISKNKIYDSTHIFIFFTWVYIFLMSNVILFDIKSFYSNFLTCRFLIWKFSKNISCVIFYLKKPFKLK